MKTKSISTSRYFSFQDKTHKRPLKEFINAVVVTNWQLTSKTVNIIKRSSRWVNLQPHMGITSQQLESALCGDANPRRLQRQSSAAQCIVIGPVCGLFICLCVSCG